MPGQRPGPGTVGAMGAGTCRPGGPEPRVIRVLIADDHPLIRTAVGELLTGAGGFRVVGECADGAEVAEAAVRTEPDVVLMDLQMPRMSAWRPPARCGRSGPTSGW